MTDDDHLINMKIFINPSGFDLNLPSMWFLISRKSIVQQILKSLITSSVKVERE
jgi:hypothetical protein